MPFFLWSTTANTNASVDPTINFAEGQAPSTLNDSNRAAMARLREFANDITGAIVTTGTSTNYAVSSYQQFDSLAHMDKQMISFVPHVTNGAFQAFLNVDGLGLKTIRSATGVDILAGTLIQGTPYTVTYNNTDGIFYLHGFFGNPYNIPLGATIEYWAGTAPNSSFVFPIGQAISRSAYSALFSLIGGQYGSGDGSTTFNLPDLRGRVTACVDNMGGVDSSRLSGSGITLSRTTLGGAGGEGTHLLTLNELPGGITSAGSASVTVTSSASNIFFSNQNPVATGVAAGGNTVVLFNASVSTAVGGVTSSGTGTASVTSNNTGGQVHNVVQPTILCNRIMRIF